VLNFQRAAGAALELGKSRLESVCPKGAGVAGAVVEEWLGARLAIRLADSPLSGITISGMSGRMKKLDGVFMGL
jgi:hypothetical protein